MICLLLVSVVFLIAILLSSPKQLVLILLIKNLSIHSSDDKDNGSDRVVTIFDPKEKVAPKNWLKCYSQKDIAKKAKGTYSKKENKLQKRMD